MKIIDEPSSSNSSSKLNDESNYTIYKTLNDLPTCNNNSVGDTVYVIKKDLMYTCENKQWNVIEFEEESSSSERRKQSDDDDDENESSSSKNKDKSSSSEKEQDLSSSSVSSSSITTTSSSMSSSSITSSSSSMSSSSITSSSSSMSSSSITISSSSVSSSSITSSSSSMSSSSITTSSSSMSSSSVTTTSSSVSSSSITTSSSSMSSSSVSSSSSICETCFIDTRDGKEYKTIQIGSQTWMAENLNYRVFYNNPTTPKDSGSYCYGDKGTSGNRGTANCETYGRLYTWAAAMDSVNQGGCGYGKECTPNTPYHQGVCPEGWHLPTRAEWESLQTNVVSANSISEDQVGKYLKTQNGWNSYSSSSGNGNDALGFSALPAGYYNYSDFYAVGYFAFFWSATEDDDINAYGEGMDYSSDYLYSGINHFKDGAFSVRCLKN